MKRFSAVAGLLLSAAAALPGLAQDTTPPVKKPASAKAATKTAAKKSVAKTAAKPAQDSTVKKAKKEGLLGPSSGDKHMAYRDQGSDLDSLWPVKKQPPLLPGSLLPAKRIVAFYGNPLSKRMGILGEFEPDEMLSKLDAEVAGVEQARSVASRAAGVAPDCRCCAGRQGT